MEISCNQYISFYVQFFLEEIVQWMRYEWNVRVTMLLKIKPINKVWFASFVCLLTSVFVSCSIVVVGMYDVALIYSRVE